MASAPHLTEQQRKWFNAVRAGLERDTGKTLEQWVEIARTCPHEQTRQRERWLKENHGIGINRASLILGEAFPGRIGWDEPDLLLDAVWKNASQRAVYDAIAERALSLDGAIATPRNSFSGFARRYQFAAVRPTKAGVRLGLAVEMEASPRLQEPRREGWSDRLHAVTVLDEPADVDDEISRLLKAAWERS